MSRLKKADAENLLRDYDTAPRDALVVALRIALDRPSAGWEELVVDADFPCARRIRLQAGEHAAMDELATELNELRALDPMGRRSPR